MQMSPEKLTSRYICAHSVLSGVLVKCPMDFTV